VKCSRSCGKTKVPFPFGIEDGCSANDGFTLVCKDAKLQEAPEAAFITYISINEGYIDTQDASHEPLPGPNAIYIDYTESRKLHWVVANLTCEEARQNISAFACISPNSMCLLVNSTYGDMGYRCKCNEGYGGNSYVTGPDGCQGPAPTRPPFSLSFFLSIYVVISW
jgi:hypothetical protein